MKSENNKFKEEKTVMDEIKESMVGVKEARKLKELNLIRKIPAKQEYEILMKCDNSGYLIYYKKI